MNFTLAIDDKTRRDNPGSRPESQKPRHKSGGTGAEKVMAAPALTRMLAFSVAGAIVGAVVGLIYGAIHAGLLLCLGTWAALAIVIGFTSTAWKPAAVSSATFGFAVSLGFLIAGYGGSEPITKPLAFFILLAFFGAACGGVLGVAARFSRTRFL